MSKDTYYFSHDYNARNDRKIAALVKEYKSSGYGIFWAACELMHEENNQLEFDDLTIDVLAKDLNEAPEYIKEVLENCVEKYRLFCKKNEVNEALLQAKKVLHSPRIARNLQQKTNKHEKKVEAGRIGGIKSGESRRNQINGEAVLEAKRSNEPNKRNKIKEIERRGIEFSADKTEAIFANGERQKLGHRQLLRLKEGGFEPHYVKFGEIE